jgi:hypothetical protein
MNFKRNSQHAVTLNNARPLNGLVFTATITHKHPLKTAVIIAAQEDVMWAVHQWKTHGIRPAIKGLGYNP